MKTRLWTDIVFMPEGWQFSIGGFDDQNNAVIFARSSMHASEEHATRAMSKAYDRLQEIMER